MTVEIISCTISTKVWDKAGIELVISASEVGLTTNYATGPGKEKM